MRVLVGSGVSRAKLVTAKLIALTEYAVLLVVVGSISALLTSLALMVTGGHDIALGSVSTSDVMGVGEMLARTIYGVFVLTVLAFTVATLTRSTPAGIGVGIGVIAVESVLKTLLVGDTIRDAFIMTNIDALQQANYYGHQMNPTGLPGTSQAAAVLGIYSIVLLALTFIAFQRRDIPSGA